MAHPILMNARKKRLAVLLSVFIASVFMALVGLTACGGDNLAAEATAAFDEQTKELVSIDDELLSQMMGASGESLQQLGVDQNEFYDALLQHFSYTVESAEQTNNRSVTLTITSSNVDLAKVLEQWQGQIGEYVKEQLSSGNLTSDSSEYATGMMRLLMDDLTSADVPTTSGTNEVIMVKDEDGNWDIENPTVAQSVVFPGREDSAS